MSADIELADVALASDDRSVVRVEARDDAQVFSATHRGAVIERTIEAADGAFAAVAASKGDSPMRVSLEAIATYYRWDGEMIAAI